MKNLLMIALLVLSFTALRAQSSVDNAHLLAMDQARTGDIDKALLTVRSAEANNPNNSTLLKDEALFCITKKDYSSAIEVAKKLIAMPNADEQAYQLLGSAYTGDSKYGEAQQAYEDGIQHYPNSSVLYAQYGEALLANGQLQKAAHAWEKGVQVNPSISSNYYFLSKYYAQHNNPLWSALYGEIFVNIESFSSRTREIKDTVYRQYIALFASPNVLNNYISNGQPFEKAVASAFAQFKDIVSGGVTPESLYSLRGQFTVNWFNSDNAKTYPYKLFDRFVQLSKIGVFQAYNQWLFSTYNESQFRNWGQMNDGEIKEFAKFQRSSVFKIPEGQYYQHN